MALLALAAGLAVLLAAGVVVPAGGVAAHDRATDGAPAHTVYVVANPIHTDIVLPATPELIRRFGFLARDGLPLGHPNVRALAIGWGGRTFYTETPTWDRLTARAVWRSATWDRSVMHVALGGAMRVGDTANVRTLAVSATAHEALLRFVEASFAREPDGAPRLLPGAGYGAFDLFYEAEGGFNLFLGCNTWTAAALRAAGVPTGWWAPLPPSLFWGLDLHGAG